MTALKVVMWEYNIKDKDHCNFLVSPSCVCIKERARVGIGYMP